MKADGRESSPLQPARGKSPSVQGLVVIGLGANLKSRFGTPAATLEACLDRLARAGLRIVRRSPWYSSRAVPHGSGPSFVNGVALIETRLRPEPLLLLLHRIERRFGRRRRTKNAPRPLDLDLIDYRGLIAEGPPALPHPRAHERAFVLLPLARVAPLWRHPMLNERARDLARKVARQGTLPLRGPAPSAVKGP